MCALNFVTFHVDVKQGNVGPHPNTNLERNRYIGMIDMMFQSARKFHPGSCCTVLTDEATRLEALSSRYSRINCTVRREKMMFDRMTAQFEFVRAYDFSLPIFLVDSDVLINNSLDSVFQHDFDIGLTWRHDSKMPINGGVIILNNRRPDAIRRFFSLFHEIYSKKYADRADWYGDQYALRDCIGMTAEEMASHQGMIEMQGCRILLLPCEQYNFSPNNSIPTIASRFRDKFVLHFKGERKLLMRLYWQAHLLPLKSWSPTVWLRAWRARHAIREVVSITKCETK